MNVMIKFKCSISPLTEVRGIPKDNCTYIIADNDVNFNVGAIPTCSPFNVNTITYKSQNVGVNPCVYPFGRKGQYDLDDVYGIKGHHAIHGHHGFKGQTHGSAPTMLTVAQHV